MLTLSKKLIWPNPTQCCASLFGLMRINWLSMNLSVPTNTQLACAEVYEMASCVIFRLPLRNPVAAMCPSLFTILAPENWASVAV